jgi:hypothetical protein
VFCTKSNWTLHIGGVRTALFNYLFAKKNNGIFFLEFTDQNVLFQVPKNISWKPNGLELRQMNYCKNENLAHTAKAKEKICTNNMLLN